MDKELKWVHLSLAQFPIGGCSCLYGRRCRKFTLSCTGSSLKVFDLDPPARASCLTMI